MASNNKRRETTRRQLEQRLQERQQHDATRKRAVLIGSVSGTIVVIAAIVVLIIVLTGGDSSKKNNQAGGNGKATPTSSAPAPTTSAAAPTTSAAPTATPCKVTHPKGSVFFDGVTVANPTKLATSPVVTSCTKSIPKALAYKDLVVGKGSPATSKSTVSVQYFGTFLSDGYQFNSSWRDNGGKATSFPLTPGSVIPGFTDGIAGSGKVPPMKVGGRRIIILPSALGYGTTGTQDGSIPPNTPLVFVVDLKSVK